MLFSPTTGSAWSSEFGANARGAAGCVLTSHMSGFDGCDLCPKGLPRHFVPGYYQPVPPGRKPFSS
jgi:hypothetical protein